MGSIMRDDSLFEVSMAEYGHMLSRFLQKIDFHLPEPYYDPKIEPALAEYIEKQPWSENLKARAAKYAKQSIGIASWYPRASFTSRLNCVIMLGLLLNVLQTA